MCFLCDGTLPIVLAVPGKDARGWCCTDPIDQFPWQWSVTDKRQETEHYFWVPKQKNVGGGGGDSNTAIPAGYPATEKDCGFYKCFLRFVERCPTFIIKDVVWERQRLEGQVVGRHARVHVVGSLLKSFVDFLGLARWSFVIITRRQAQ